MAAVALAILAFHWIAIFSFILPRTGRLDFLRLHYTAALGVDWVGVWWMIFVFPLLGLLTLLINGLLSGILSRKQPLYGLMILGATVCLEIVLAIGGGAAVLLNS